MKLMLVYLFILCSYLTHAEDCEMIDAECMVKTYEFTPQPGQEDDCPKLTPQTGDCIKKIHETVSKSGRSECEQPTRHGCPVE